MDPWSRVKAIFDAAVVLDSRGRADCLADMCGDDPVLRQQVEALLVARNQAETFLETPAAGVAASFGTRIALIDRRHMRRASLTTNVLAPARHVR